MTDSQRYQRSLSCDGRPMMRGWWGNEPIARRKWTSVIGERGGILGTRIVLTDGEASAAVTTWPDGGRVTSGAGRIRDYDTP